MEDKDSSGEGVRAGISTRAAEIVVALFLLGLGSLVVYDSVRLGMRWGTDGPQSGYFPFYIGLLICISSVVTLLQTLVSKTAGQKIFVEWGQLKLVMMVLVPAAFFVLGIQLIGIYVAAAVYIAVFMIWLGKYAWIKSILLGVAVSAFTFVTFEIWFKVPLFKGAYNPLSLIGY